MTSEVIDGPQAQIDPVAWPDASSGPNPRGDHPMSDVSITPFLRRVLLLDALTSGIAGVLMIAAGPNLSTVLGLPGTLLVGAGLLLLPFAYLVHRLAKRDRAASGLVWAVIGVNAVWAVDSLFLLAIGWITPTPAGFALILIQAGIVALFAELEYVGLRGGSTVPA